MKLAIGISIVAGMFIGIAVGMAVIAVAYPTGMWLDGWRERRRRNRIVEAVDRQAAADDQGDKWAVMNRPDRFEMN